jgi:predicted small lipoprotein YifL
MPRLLCTATLIAFGLALNGCGVRGALDPPSGAKAETTGADAKKQADVPKPHRPFVLDGLIK